MLANAIEGGEGETMAEDFNQRVVREFRAGGGRVDGFPDLLLLTTAGRRTGRPRTTPLAYRQDGSRYLVFGSNGGAAEHPQWYRNLLAAGGGTVELPDGEGGLTILSVRPVELDAAERDREFAEQARRVPSFADYAERTDRTIPVLALHPLDLSADPALAARVLGQLQQHHEDLRRQLADLRTRLDHAGPAPHPTSPPNCASAASRSATASACTTPARRAPSPPSSGSTRS
ncbi:nitroreductase/quinone reductase family protein [Kitasatospora cheerisanensis]|uniref:nitroreductase/quinone reductase family protein n=1 Tax=Kitasatospora cheerisanensis TaxID=81942 RepID=UPI001FCA7864|nr:nitroreductase/quinone reductase family protein [Kitasatospora cheerisanensis]